MTRWQRLFACAPASLAALVLVLGAAPALASNLTLTQGGPVSVELTFSDATFSNTLAIATGGVVIARSGCNLTTSNGITGTPLLSEKTAQRGCRVDLDADGSTPGIQPFAAGTTLEFRMCAKTNSDDTCDNVWSSDPGSNSDHFDHVHTTELNAAQFPGRAFRLAWEDLPDGGDNDFNDLVAVVRVGGDQDGDGLWDDWETLGIDTDGDGTIDLDLPSLGAIPGRRNLFLEADYMNCTVAGGDCAAGDTHSHQPKPGAVAAVVNAFASHNVINPDGTTGITLRVDVDTALPHTTLVDLGCNGGPDTFDPIKKNPANFGTTNPRRFAYRYMIFGHRQGAATTSSGCGEIDGNDTLITLGEWNTACVGPGANNTLDTATSGDDVVVSGVIYAGGDLVCNSTAAGDDFQVVARGSSPRADLDGDGLEDRHVGTLQQQAGTIMHEFGHNLSLQHGGNEGKNFKPNYVSIMNYAFQTRGIAGTDPDGAGPLSARIDYSSVALASLNETSLSEPTGLQGTGTDQTRFNCPAGTGTSGPVTGPLDWNCDGDTTDTGVSSDLNGDSTKDTLTGFDDWDAVHLGFQNTTDFEDGLHQTLVSEPQTFELYLKTNLPPVASICPGAPLECTGPKTTVTVNGACSFDPDGKTILDYAWTTPPSCTAVLPALGSTLQAICPVGTGTFGLVVTDPDGAHSAPTSAAVAVVDTTPPVITPNPPAALAFSVCDDDPVTLTLAVPAASDLCGGTTLTGAIIAANGHSLVTPEAVVLPGGQVTLRSGQFVVRWTATDDHGNSSHLDETLTVTAKGTLALCCPGAGTTITGTDGADVLVRLPSASSFKVDARGGADQIVLGTGDDCVVAGAGSDNFSSAGGRDVAHGGTGDDALSACLFATGGSFEGHGNAGSDNISGRFCGRVSLYGGPGDDNLTGSDGNDTLVPGSGADVVTGLGGDDTVVLYDACEATPSKLLDGGPGIDTLVTPLSIPELQARGVVVLNFEHVVIKTDQRHLADCFGN